MSSVGKYLFASVIATLLCACSVDDDIDLGRILIYEKSDDQIDLTLSWKINGEDDDGMLADMMLYISRSADMSDAAISPLLGNLTISYPDYYGNQLIFPSNRYMFDAYRFYLGVGFHGITSPDLAVNYPIRIDYTIIVSSRKTGQELHRIEKTMTVEQADAGQTVAEYPYTIDVIENEPETDHRNYSFRELEKPVRLVRENDVQKTQTFAADKNLYADLTWWVNGEFKGYRKIDLDLFIHDTGNTNIESFADLDDMSASEDSYEGIRIAPENTYFKDGIPEKLGFYFFDNVSGEPATVKYLYTFYAIDGKIKRHFVEGTFTTPPVLPNQGTFYFHINIVKNGDVYEVSELPEPLIWTP